MFLDSRNLGLKRIGDYNMKTILIGAVIILATTTVYFALCYYKMKQKIQLGKEENGDVAAPASFNDFEEKVKTLSTTIHQKEEIIVESGEIASEKGDIVRAAIDEVGRGLTKQSLATEESSTALEEMTAAIVDLADRANQISDHSQSTLELTKQGNEALQVSIKKMEHFNEIMSESNSSIKNLGYQSKEIGTIVKVITGISEQINLLALNAAIEAARAGEHGRGFAVVADEVRKLAEQAKGSADEVANIVKSTQAETDNVVKVMEQGTVEFKETNQALTDAGNKFEQILTSIKSIADNNNDSSATTEELSASSQQIMSSFEQITSISQESVEMFEELMEISDDQLNMMEELVQEAKSLREIKEDIDMLFVSSEEKNIA